MTLISYLLQFSSAVINLLDLIQLLKQAQELGIVTQLLAMWEQMVD